jgi:hypothetical protein
MAPNEYTHKETAEDEFTPEELANLRNLYEELHRNPPTEEDLVRGRQRFIELLGDDFEDSDYE